MADTSGPDDDHLIDLAEGWRLWRLVCLRGAGFPVDMLKAVVAGEAVASIDRLLDREAAFEELREQALQVCREATATLDREARKPFRKAIRLLAKGRVPAPIAGTEDLAALLSALSQAAEARDDARKLVNDALAADERLVSEKLLEICREPRFREALVWQNRHALSEGVDVLARMDPEARNRSRRKHEQLVFNYVQRYCAKNDTIGFFGPVAWPSFVDDGPAMILKPGPSLLALRRTHFEYWAINTLAEVLSKDKDLLPSLSPRINPRFHVDESGRLCKLGDEPRLVHARINELLAACNGETSAADLVARLASGRRPGFESETEVHQTLTELAQREIIFWDAYVPVTPRADEALLAKLESVRDPGPRRQAIAKLEGLRAGRAAVEAARGDPAAMDSAMASLESEFQRLTGTGPTRHDGATYGGRTLLYEDCRRDLALTLGPEVRRRIGPAMALILRAANWYLHQVGVRFTQLLENEYASAEAQTRGQAVSFEAMVFRNRRVWEGGQAIVDQVVEALTQRWMSVLNLDASAHQVRLKSEELRAKVHEAFPEAPLLWPSAKYHSPDLMIAAESVEDICEGRFIPVLGEFNAGVNRLGLPTLSLLHPDPEAIIGYMNSDLRRRRILRTNSRHAIAQRVVFDTTSSLDFHLAVNDTPSWRPSHQVLPISDLVVERSPVGLVVKERGGERRFHIADFFAMLIGPGYWNKIAFLPSAPHLPRLVIDDLVISRERWVIPCGEVTFAQLSTTEERFIAARRFMRSLGLPRWVFLRVPYERKPLYLDFESPLAVDALAKVIRRGAEEDPPPAATFSEMLPTPEQCWLTDAEGNRYTSEFRLAVVNPETWQPKKVQSKNA